MSNDNQLEQGCLAIITQSSLGAADGKIVTCIQVDGFHPELGVMWLVESQTPIMDDMGGLSTDVHVPAAWLKKIPREPLPDRETPVTAPTEELEGA